MKLYLGLLCHLIFPAQVAFAMYLTDTTRPSLIKKAQSISLRDLTKPIKVEKIDAITILT